jgi:carbon monoxide dehydrogenase subunit G
MPSVEKTIDVAATPEEAFAFASDTSRFDEWLTIHSGWPQGAPGKPEQGQQFVQKITIMGMPADVSWTVTETSPTSVSMSGAGPMGAQLSCTISTTASGDGAAVSYESEFSGGGLVGPMGDMVTKKFGEELEASLGKLKELVA